MKAEVHTIFIVSGGAGTSGEQVVHTVLAQFPESRARVVTAPNVRFESQIEEIVTRAQAVGATLVHTLVDERLRARLETLAAERGVAAVDLMGPLFEQLAAALEQPPLGQPGLYRQLNKAYFDRVAAIEYTMAQDDGKRSENWGQAEIVLVGVSRVGKTPLSLYLSVLGWKVANVPVVVGLELPEALFHLDPQRVIGLTVEPGQLLAFRQQRQQRLGVSGQSDYVAPEKVYEELQYALKLCRRSGFTVIDVTDKPIETIADEVMRLVTSRSGTRSRPG
ncbi:MAG: pyruvate, water dikinase regulatory protein [Chloroflexota bacterium]